jgi:hypothetical protein
VKSDIKSKSKPLRNIKIEETAHQLKIIVRGHFRISPQVKKALREKPISTMITISGQISAFIISMVLCIYCILWLLKIIQSIHFSIQLLAIYAILFLLCFTSVLASITLYAISLLLASDFVERTTILITKTEINDTKLREDGKNFLCGAPFKAVYIRATSDYKRFPFSVIMHGDLGKRVKLFENLTHEQAVYIARVIHQYLKLDAPEGDFNEPDFLRFLPSG